MSSDPREGREDAQENGSEAVTPDPDESRIFKERSRESVDEERRRLLGDPEITRLVEGLRIAAHGGSVTPEGWVTPTGESKETWLGAERSTEDIQSSIEPGMVLLNKYQVLEKLGQGGMASVWLVQHLGFGETRALKVIHPFIARRSNTRERFDREARILAKLKHPSAVIVYDTGVVGDLRYIEMEYLQGKTLRDVLRSGDPCPLAWVQWVLREVCAVLGRAHDLGIVHLDLKPANIMITTDPVSGLDQVKVLDFGIAMILVGEDEPDKSTVTGVWIEGSFGTPAYSSPEQFGLLRSAESPVPIDHRSDLYSLGVMLYEMLTGAPPFQGASLSLLEQHAHKKPPRFAEIAPKIVVPRAIEDLVLQCLEKRANDRPKSASEVAERFTIAIKEARTRPGPVGLLSALIKWLGRMLERLVPGWAAPHRQRTEAELRMPMETGEVRKLPAMI